MSNRKMCVCGRSKTNYCDGSHSVTQKESQNKKSESVGSKITAQLQETMLSSEMGRVKARARFAQPSLHLNELDAFIRASFSRRCSS